MPLVMCFFSLPCACQSASDALPLLLDVHVGDTENISAADQTCRAAFQPGKCTLQLIIIASPYHHTRQKQHLLVLKSFKQLQVSC